MFVDLGKIQQYTGKCFPCNCMKYIRPDMTINEKKKSFKITSRTWIREQRAGGHRDNSPFPKIDIFQRVDVITITTTPFHR